MRDREYVESKKFQNLTEMWNFKFY